MEKDNEAALAFLVVDADKLSAPAPDPNLPAVAAAAGGPAQQPRPEALSSANAHGGGGGSASHEGLQAVLEHAGRSEPLFLLFRNGQLKARVAGANLPKLTALVMEHTPNNPESDDLEVWPGAGPVQGLGQGAAGLGLRLHMHM